MRPAGKGLYLNQTMLEMLGYTREELRDRQITDFLPSGEGTRIAQFLKDSADGEGADFETWVQRKDGQWIPVRYKAAALTRGTQEPSLWALFFTDLSPQQTLRDRLRRRCQAEESVFSQLPGLFCTARRDLSLSYWNSNLPKETGWAGEDLGRMRLDQLIEPTKRHMVQDLAKAGEEGTGSAYLEANLTTPEGTTGPFRICVMPMEGSDEEAVTVFGLRLAGSQPEAPPEEATDRTLFASILRKEVVRSYRYGNPLSLLVVSLANYSEIRERVDSQTMKRVSADLGMLLRSHTRESDHVFLGEECQFFVIAPETDPSQAEELKGRLEGIIHGHDFDPVAWVQPAIGWSTYQAGDNAEKLFQRAQGAALLAS